MGKGTGGGEIPRLILRDTFGSPAFGIRDSARSERGRTSRLSDHFRPLARPAVPGVRGFRRADFMPTLSAFSLWRMEGRWCAGRFGGSKGNFVAPRTDETAGKRTKKNRFIKQTTATLDAPTRQISRVNNATSTLNPYGCPISRRHRGAHLREARPPQPRRRRRVFIARATLLGQLVGHSPP